MILLAGGVVLTAGPVAAYSPLAHVVIAELARSQLSATTQIRADAIASALLATQPEHRRAEIRRPFPGASDFAVLAAMPDDWKRNRIGAITLDDVFRWYLAGPVTGPYESASLTAGWHFSDAPYPHERGDCDLSRDTDLRDGLGRSRAAFLNATNDRARGVALAFIEHLVGDAHQPLHAVSRVDAACGSDRGGNGFCLTDARVDGRCEESLHRLWDRGVESIVERAEIERAVAELLRLHPRDEVAREGVLEPRVWLEEGRAEASFVYDTREGERPSDAYLALGRQISQRRMALAGYRLAALIELLIAGSGPLEAP